MKTVIQNVIYPGLSFTAPEDMYLRGDYFLDKESQKITVIEGGYVSFDTYFNAISINTWKRDCGIEDLYFSVDGEGDCLVELCHRLKDEQPQILMSFNIKLNGLKKYISVKDWVNIDDGFLYIQIKAITDCTLKKIDFATETEGNSRTKLGLVITHYNRQKNVCMTISRIEDELLNLSNDSKIKLIIIDNSRNLNIKSKSSNVIIIPSKNLGGAGGFTRGLMYLKESSYTHCCFMDDDANCEVEAIRRTFIYFSYISKKNKQDVAVSGTLLHEEAPNIILEAGASFHRGRWIPTSHKLNVSSFDSLYNLEAENLRSNYGAWCYFAFDIRYVKHYAYPFFVRGDDIFFGISNKFKVKTINGVCTWVDNFGLKDSPMTRYLAFRAVSIIPMLQGDFSRFRFIKNFYKWHSDCLLKYNYASARAIEMAVSDIINGPHVIEEDVGAIHLREKLKPLVDSEKLTYRKEEVVYQIPKKSLLKDVLRFISIKGLLIPTFFYKNTIIQMKETNGRKREIFLSKGVFYYNRCSGFGYLAEYNKLECLKRILNRTVLVMEIFKNYNEFSRSFYKSGEVFTSSNFWERHLF